MSVLSLPGFFSVGLRPRLLLSVLPPTVAALLIAFASAEISAGLKQERAEAVLNVGADRAAGQVGATARRLEGLAIALALRPDLATALQAGDAASLRGLATGAFRAAGGGRAWFETGSHAKLGWRGRDR
jgi:hypothetical protein